MVHCAVQWCCAVVLCSAVVEWCCAVVEWCSGGMVLCSSAVQCFAVVEWCTVLCSGGMVHHNVAQPQTNGGMVQWCTTTSDQWWDGVQCAPQPQTNGGMVQWCSTTSDQWWDGVQWWNGAHVVARHLKQGAVPPLLMVSTHVSTHVSTCPVPRRTRASDKGC